MRELRSVELPSCRSVACGENQTFAVSADGTLFEWGNGHVVPQPIANAYSGTLPVASVQQVSSTTTTRTLSCVLAVLGSQHSFCNDK